FDGPDEVHVPQYAGDLAARYARKGEDRRRGAAAKQRLRSTGGCSEARALAVRRASAELERREARAEGQSSGAGAALHHLFDGGAERGVNRLFRRFLREGPGAGTAFRRTVLRAVG